MSDTALIAASMPASSFTPSTPAIVPTAPAPQQGLESDGSGRWEDDLVLQTFSETVTRESENDGGRARDPATGRFLPTAAQVAAQQTAQQGAQAAPGDAIPGADGTTPAADVPVAPAGYTLAQPLPDDKARGWKVFDAEGEVAPPNLRFDIVADGKPRSLDTAQLVSFAQMGVYNHERVQQQRQTEQQNATLTQDANNLREQVQQYERHLERLLTDADYLSRTITEFDRQNTPEARFARQQEHLAARERAIAHTELQKCSEEYMAVRLGPALEEIVKMLPTIDRTELGQYVLGWAADRRFIRDGVILPEGQQPIADFITRHVLHEAQQLHVARLEQRGAPAKVATLAADNARLQARAQQARNASARAQRTVPVSQPTSIAAAANGKPLHGKSLDEAMISNTLSGLQRTG